MTNATNPITKTLYLALSLSLLTVGLAPLASAIGDGDGEDRFGNLDDHYVAVSPDYLDLPRTHPDPPFCFEDGKSDDAGATSVLCPDLDAEPGAACVSHGLLVVERDTTNTVGDVTLAQSTSRADTRPTSGPTLNPDPYDGEPVDNPDAHANAEQVGVSYTSGAGGLSLDAEIVDSQCDVAARDEFPLRNAAYGDAGIADLEITQAGTSLVSADVLRQTIDAAGSQYETEAGHECEIVQLQIFSTGPSTCPSKNTGIPLPGASLVLNEVWGPVSSGSGQHIYGGAAAHLTIFGSLQTVDVYLGYTAVQVHGEEPSSPDPI